MVALWLASGRWEVVDLIHDELVGLLKDYYLVGGMPEAVQTFVDTGDYHETRRVQKRILRAYDRDFVKHAEPTLLGRIRLLWKNIPAQLAKENAKFVYKVLKEGARGRDYEDFSAFKLFVHDVGLLGTIILTVRIIRAHYRCYRCAGGLVATNFWYNLTVRRSRHSFCPGGAGDAARRWRGELF